MGSTCFPRRGRWFYSLINPFESSFFSLGKFSQQLFQVACFGAAAAVGLLHVSVSYIGHNRALVGTVQTFQEADHPTPTGIYTFLTSKWVTVVTKSSAGRSKGIIQTSTDSRRTSLGVQGTKCRLTRVSDDRLPVRSTNWTDEQGGTC